MCVCVCVCVCAAGLRSRGREKRKKRKVVSIVLLAGRFSPSAPAVRPRVEQPHLCFPLNVRYAAEAVPSLPPGKFFGAVAVHFEIVFPFKE